MTLVSRNKIEDMVIGDMIPCRYKASSVVPGEFYELGTCTASEIAVTGTATPDGKFNFIKVAKGLLIADRVVQTSISWNALNSSRYIQGLDFKDISNKLAIPESINTSNYGEVQITQNCATGWQAFAKDNTYYTYPAKSYGIITTYFPAGKKITSINVKNPHPSYYIGCRYFEFWGSYNDTDFVLLCSSNLTYEGSFDYDIPNPEQYKYYKFVGAPSGDYLYVNLRYYVADSTFSGKGIIRSLTGGNAYIDTDGKASLTDKGLGAWPTNNEWDKYIVSSDLGGKIVPGDDAVWHWSGDWSWVTDTPSSQLWAASNRIARGDHRVTPDTNIRTFWYAPSSGAYSSGGFRPVLEYSEDPRCTNIWY